MHPICGHPSMSINSALLESFLKAAEHFTVFTIIQTTNEYCDVIIK